MYLENRMLQPKAKKIELENLKKKNWTTGAKKKMIWHQMNRKDLSLLSAKVSFVGFDVADWKLPGDNQGTSMWKLV